MTSTTTTFSRRIMDATTTVFGDSPLTLAVEQACKRFENDVQNIQASRGIGGLLIAIVGAKGQGKTWVARQLVREPSIQNRLRSGDLVDDATTRLVWVGPIAPERLDPVSEIYHPCQPNQMAQLGQPYVILDTPGLTDADQRAAGLAKEALSLAAIKLLVIARDQIRAAANMTLAHQIDGSVCIPVVSSVEPEEMPQGQSVGGLRDDMRGLRDQLQMLAPRSLITSEILVPDFEVSGDEAASSQAFLSGLLDRFSELDLTHISLNSARELQLQAAGERLQAEVSKHIGDELPQLADAVDQLNRETQQLPSRVLASLLGSESVLETGVRMRLRARLASDTSLMWFPYRTILSTLHLTQGAWDRVMLAMAGSVPSLFGTLASMARNVRSSREFNSQIQDGIRQRTQQQVEERLQPLCDQFHRTVMKLRPRADRSRDTLRSTAMHLTGIEELQTRSQHIFDQAIEHNAAPRWLVQLLACIGVLIFWALMAGPVVVVYREYIQTSLNVLLGKEANLDSFPHPTPALFFTSLLLSGLPLVIYCMLILTWLLNHRQVRRVAKGIVAEHERAIDELKNEDVIRLQFEDELLQQAEYLLNLRK